MAYEQEITALPLLRCKCYSQNAEGTTSDSSFGCHVAMKSQSILISASGIIASEELFIFHPHPYKCDLENKQYD